MKNVVILGASLSGVSTAHRILKEAGKTGPFKVTLVSPNTHFYWCIASVRGILPGEFPDEKLFHQIAPGFSKYPASQFEFIVASAESLDVEAKKVVISSSTFNTTLDYDFLILATGSRSVGGTPFKELESTQATKDALHDYQARLSRAKTVVVAGGGVTGVEVAGELASNNSVTLIASGPTILDYLPAPVSKNATNTLQKLKVNMKLQKRVTSSTQLPNGQQELTLSDGEKLVADIYIPTFGLIPNSSFIPTQFLNTNGYVIVDSNLLVKGAESIWAIGDVSEFEPMQAIYCNYQSIHVAKNIALILSNKAPLPYKPSKISMLGLTIGKKNAAGHIGGWKFPSFLIIYLKKTMLVEKLPGTVDGSGV